MSGTRRSLNTLFKDNMYVLFILIKKIKNYEVGLIYKKYFLWVYLTGNTCRKALLIPLLFLSSESFIGLFVSKHI